VSKIETGRYGDLLRRFLNAKGTEDIAGDLAPEISPVFVLENNRPDWHYLKNERLAAFFTAQVSGASAGPTVRLRNPTGSGVIATFSTLDWSFSANDHILIAMNLLDANLAGGVLPSTNRDGRQLMAVGQSNSALIVSFVLNAAPVGDVFFGNATAANEGAKYQEPIVLSPGRSIDIGTTDVGVVTLRVSAAWVERALPAVERGE